MEKDVSLFLNTLPIFNLQGKTPGAQNGQPEHPHRCSMQRIQHTHGRANLVEANNSIKEFSIADLIASYGHMLRPL
jgi:hypothetical protein